LSLLHKAKPATYPFPPHKREYEDCKQILKLLLPPPSSKLSGTCPLAKASLSSHRRSRLSVSERTQPYITRFARLIPLPRAARCKSPLGCLLIAHEVWRLKPFPLQSRKTPACNAHQSPLGKNDLLRYRRPEWTVSTPWLPSFFRLYIFCKSVRKLCSFFFLRNV